MEDIAKGATKGFFEHWEEKLPDWLSRLKNHEIRFIQDKQTYEIAKNESENPEYKLFKQFADKGWPRLVFKLGLALRAIESDKEKIELLKTDIVRRDGVDGVRAAQLAQRGILTQLLTQLTKLLGNEADVKKKLNLFLENVSEIVLWVESRDRVRVKRLCDLVKTKVDGSALQMTIVLGSGSAKSIVRSILECVKKDMRNYYMQVQEDGQQLAGFVFDPSLAGKLTYWSEPFARA
ncbi:MAG: hypothetical protein JRN58_09430 [Nitrososphaerota archaeon]|nr:hypothetical protein [Nitrososphaerota archaeon]MDG6966707.1 hypothetical protein [Nitrososphaerota archaeon]MDG6979286.1 hypothetical protein [Nitrososphaerota archaeon]